MCGAAAIPVLKFIAPMVLPSLANRIFGGKQSDAKPANFQQTAAPGTKLAGQAAQLGEDETAKEEVTTQETEASKTAKLRKIRQNDPNKTTGASNAPAASGVGANIGGTSQQTGGITTPTAAAY